VAIQTTSFERKEISVRGSFRPLIACLLAVLLATLVMGVASAQTQRSIVGPGESIQRAVNAAAPGNTILVRGTHHETVVIRKDGITLTGDDAVLKPPNRPTSPCGPSGGPSGFCLRGNVNPQTGNVSEYVEDVTVTGFTIRNFPGTGIVTLGARNATLANNRAFGNHEYGIFAITSTGTRIVSNVTSGSEDAGLYVGDSPRANATVASNETYGNALGILVRNALGGSISANSVHNNCLGVFFVADAPGPAGAFEVRGNMVKNNTRSCPPHGPVPPLSGIGIALAGARDVKLQGNHILGNVPSGPSAIHYGGAVVVRGIEGTPPRGNSVVGNTIQRNRPDIFWDKSGSGNRFVGNGCKTSKPGGLC
jgi:parallel beta-helix repeat protein